MTYTITIANSGRAPTPGRASPSRWAGCWTTPPTTSDRAAGQRRAPCHYASPDLAWTGDVPAGGTVTITYSVTVHNPDTGNQILAST